MEPNIRRAVRATMSTVSVPTIAAENRQPRLLLPKIHSPNAIIHLPSGGWTTKPGPSFLAFSSTPCCSRFHESCA